MTKLLFIGDLHLRGNNPRHRIDDYQEAAVEKLKEIFSLAAEHNVDAILQPGDVFDRPEVSISVLLQYTRVFKQSPVPIYVTIGNHCIYGYNLHSFERSSLRLLEMLVPQLTVIWDDTARTVGTQPNVILTATPYSRLMDIDGYGYDVPETALQLSGTRIHIAHGMLLDHVPPFDRYTLIDSCKTRADVVLTGHDHVGYGVYRRADGVLFCNPGAVMRMSASITEIERPVQVALITVEPEKDVNIQLIPLKCAKPGNEVLDRSAVDAANERRYAMETFSTLIQAHTGDKVLLDINQIIESIAAEENYAPNVVNTALAVIDRERETVKQ